MGVTGLEPRGERSGVSGDSEKGWPERGGPGGAGRGAVSGASGGHTVDSDPDLALVVDTWSRLTTAQRERILAVIAEARR